MSQEYVIYCDESTEKGKFYSNFYGGALVRSADIDAVRKALKDKKEELNFGGEIKWDKVTSNYLQKYKDLMDLFFDLIAKDTVKVRIMFTQNINKPINLTEEQVEQTYFILYYHFLKLAFGLAHSNDGKQPVYLRLLLDQLPDTKEKALKFKAYLCALSKNPQFRAAKVAILEHFIADVKSHEHDILQCLDVVLGSMQFRLNDMYKAMPKGKKRRGKRTKAKHALYRHINAHIRKIYPGFNVGTSTGTAKGIEDRWRHPYRHWLFVPSEREQVPGMSKKKK
jgi:hypothetical protein